jgi:hypothetical protein
VKITRKPDLNIAKNKILSPIKIPDSIAMCHKYFTAIHKGSTVMVLMLGTCNVLLTGPLHAQLH